MASKPRTNILLIILAVVSVGVLGYFVWLFLAPSGGVVPAPEPVSTEVQSDLVNTPSYRALRPYANLPVVATNVGRVNPFAPFIIPDANTNENANTNAPENVNGQ
jgi:hypothetical protein